jgi:hypothetical protein
MFKKNTSARQVWIGVSWLFGFGWMGACYALDASEETNLGVCDPLSYIKLVHIFVL